MTDLLRLVTKTVAALLIAGAALVAACTRATTSRAQVVTEARVSMGSALRVSAWTSDEPHARTAFDAVFREFDRLESLMTVWRPDSEISRLNAAAGDRPVPMHPEVLDVLRTAHQVSEWTGGKFDVTFAALSDLWRFDQDQDGRVPDPGDVRRRLPLISYRDLVLDDGADTAFLRRKGMRVNLGGIGKGYAIGRAADVLRARGLRDFMIQSGGDLYVAGLKDGRPWRLGIADPRDPDRRTFATIDLTDSTFSTSGDYERAFIKNGRRYHHIIDPATGEPANLCRSVTIVADSPVVSDGLSTGVFILGPSAGMALVERLPHIGAVIVTSRNEVLVSSRLKGRLTLVAPPTDGP